MRLTTCGPIYGYKKFCLLLGASFEKNSSSAFCFLAKKTNLSISVLINFQTLVKIYF